MEHRLLGASGIEVSALSLGSWRTFERITREEGVAVMTAARENVGRVTAFGSSG